MVKKLMFIAFMVSCIGFNAHAQYSSGIRPNADGSCPSGYYGVYTSSTQKNGVWVQDTKPFVCVENGFVYNGPLPNSGEVTEEDYPTKCPHGGSVFFYPINSTNPVQRYKSSDYEDKDALYHALTEAGYVVGNFGEIKPRQQYTPPASLDDDYSNYRCIKTTNVRRKEGAPEEEAGYCVCKYRLPLGAARRPR